MLDGGEAAQPGHLLYLKGAVGEQDARLVHAGGHQLRLGGGVEEQPVVAVELAFTHAAPGQQPVDGPVLLAGFQHFQAERLKGLKESGVLGGTGRRMVQGTGDQQNQRFRQKPDFLLVIGRFFQVFPLDFLQKIVDGGDVGGIEGTVFGDRIFFLQRKIRGKVHIAVPEFPDGLVILADTGRVQDAGVFSENGDLSVHPEFHGGFQQEKKIIPAALGTVDPVAVRIGTVIFTVMNFKHKTASFRGW